jgi:hypothetical protein
MCESGGRTSSPSVPRARARPTWSASWGVLSHSTQDVDHIRKFPYAAQIVAFKSATRARLRGRGDNPFNKFNAIA